MKMILPNCRVQFAAEDMDFSYRISRFGVIVNALRALNVTPDSEVTNIIIPTDGAKESM